jgi:hypothetical protein
LLSIPFFTPYTFSLGGRLFNFVFSSFSHLDHLVLSALTEESTLLGFFLVVGDLRIR